MRIDEAIEILRAHNIWRRYDGPIGEGPKSTDPSILGDAIDTVAETFSATNKEWVDDGTAVMLEERFTDKWFMEEGRTKMPTFADAIKFGIAWERAQKGGEK